MPQLNPPNAPNTELVQVPIPTPVAPKPKAPAPVAPQAAAPPTPKAPDPFRRVQGQSSLILPYPSNGDAGKARAAYRTVTRAPVQMAASETPRVIPKNPAADLLAALRGHSGTSRFAGGEMPSPHPLSHKNPGAVVAEAPFPQPHREEHEEPEEQEHTCPNCDATGSEPVERADGDDACEDCSTQCANCEAWRDPDDIHENVRVGRGARDWPGVSTYRNGQQLIAPICNDCFDNGGNGANYFRCADCYREFDDNLAGGNNTNDEQVCENCAENYFRCDRCDQTYDNDHYHGYGICDDCHQQEEEENQEPEESEEPDFSNMNAADLANAGKIHAVELPVGKKAELPAWLNEPDSIKIWTKEPGGAEAIQKFFGGDITKEHFAQMAGLVNGHHALVTIGSSAGRGTLGISAINPDFDTPDTDTDKLKHSMVDVAFYTDDKNKIHCNNQLVVVGKYAGPLLGHGREIYHAQIMALREAGVTRIHSSLAITDAQTFWSPTVYPPDPENQAHWVRHGYVGGKVWPLFGFGGTLSDETQRKIPSELRSQMKGDDVRDLLDVPGGAKWWQGNAEWVHDGYMDMDPESRTGQAHDAAWAALEPRIRKLEQRLKSRAKS